MNSIPSAKNIPNVDIAMKRFEASTLTFKVILKQCLNFIILKAPATSRSIVNIVNSPNQRRHSKMLKQGDGQLLEASSD